MPTCLQRILKNQGTIARPSCVKSSFLFLATRARAHLGDGRKRSDERALECILSVVVVSWFASGADDHLNSGCVLVTNAPSA